jgi:hypothetical protein
VDVDCSGHGEISADHPDDALPAGDDAASVWLRSMQVVGDWLTGRGWPAKLTSFGYCGEADLRLSIHRPDSAIAVEILTPTPHLTEGGWWDAVRIKPASRLVWRGPDTASTPEGLLRFAEDLLSADMDELLGRYRLLG